MREESAQILDAVTGKPVGGRRVPRPRAVEGCTRCGEALGARYTDCPLCHEAIERYWLADWRALLEREGVGSGTDDERLLAQVVLAEYECHPWTEMDIAMSLLHCGTCGAELGECYSDCAECGMALGASVMAEFGATPNEHALHIGRWVLRYPERHSANAVRGWRLTMPRILTGWLPTTQGAQRAAAMIKAARLYEVEQMLRVVDEEIRANNG